MFPIPNSEEASTVILRKWNRLAGLIGLPFMLIWDAFLVIWFVGLAATGEPPGLMLLFVLFPVLHVVAGIVGTWSTVQNLFNTTRIEAGPRVVRVRVGPLAFSSANREHSVVETTQFFVDKQTRKYGLPIMNNQQKYIFRVSALQKNGTVVPLLENMTIEEARAVERVLEDHYTITDATVGGEESHTPMAHDFQESFPVMADRGGLSMVDARSGGELSPSAESGSVSVVEVFHS